MAYSPGLGSHFLSYFPLLFDNSSLCQINIKVVITETVKREGYLKAKQTKQKPDKQKQKLATKE